MVFFSITEGCGRENNYKWKFPTQAGREAERARSGSNPPGRKVKPRTDRMLVPGQKFLAPQECRGGTSACTCSSHATEAASASGVLAMLPAAIDRFRSDQVRSAIHFSLNLASTGAKPFRGRSNPCPLAIPIQSAASTLPLQPRLGYGAPSQLEGRVGRCGGACDSSAPVKCQAGDGARVAHHGRHVRYDGLGVPSSAR